MSRNLPSQLRSARACSAEYPIKGDGSSEVVPKSTTDARITRTTSTERRINKLPWLLLKMMTSAGLHEQVTCTRDKHVEPRIIVFVLTRGEIHHVTMCIQTWQSRDGG